MAFDRHAFRDASDLFLKYLGGCKMMHLPVNKSSAMEYGDKELDDAAKHLKECEDCNKLSKINPEELADQVRVTKNIYQKLVDTFLTD
jgi:hypothetical protein